MAAKKKKQLVSKESDTAQSLTPKRLIKVSALIGGVVRQCSIPIGTTVGKFRKDRGIPDTVIPSLLADNGRSELEVSEKYILKHEDHIVFMNPIPDFDDKPDEVEEVTSQRLPGTEDLADVEVDTGEDDDREMQAKLGALFDKAANSPSVAIVLLEKSVEIRFDAGIVAAVRILKKMGIKANITVSAPYTSDAELATL